jgi:hypothetical protein
MASHKNQHFVPRCYLKAFSHQGEGRAINLFNIDRGQAIQNAPLKSQCSSNYFYGEDLELERLLQHSEGLYAGALGRIEDPQYCLNDKDRAILRHFIYLQHCRTRAAVERAAAIPASMAEVAFAEGPPPDWRTTQRQNVVIAMQAFADTMRIVYDLKVCLIRNETHLDFITSDDPVVLTNRFYLQDSRAKGMSAAAGNAGALFILPLTPKIACLAYDGDVYSIANTQGWVTARRSDDIAAVNEHQYLCCAANIYFADWSDCAGVNEAYQALKGRRPSVRPRLTTAELSREDEEGAHFRVVPQADLTRERRAVIHFQSVTPTPSRWPSCVKWRSPRKLYSNNTGTGFVRAWSIAEGFAPGSKYRKLS